MELPTRLGPSTFPLALFPVRLETRYFIDANQVTELRIRVYPDKIHLDAHDPALTADELAAGQRYWRALWPAGSDDAAALRAWQVLAGQVGARRAAWIQRLLTPTNQAERPAGEPRFPDAGPPATTSPTPRARLLPDRWIATAYVDGAPAAVVTGRDIVPDLAVGPDLSAPVTIEDETPAIDAGLRWMIDFEEAERVGMALRMTVPGDGNVDLLLVTGVSLRDRSADVAAAFDAHHYTDGLEFLAPGTPTSNPPAGRTPYREADPHHELSFDREVSPAAPVPRSFAELAHRAFGVNVFAHIAGAHDTDEAIGAAMATALWPATWGYLLSTMVGLEEGGLTQVDSVRRHALAFVRPGGPLPVLRAGIQPYGVLPVTSLDAWQVSDADAAVSAMRTVLVALRDTAWHPAAAGRLARIGNTDDPNTDLADVLQTGALSTSFALRGVRGAHVGEHLRATLGANPEPPEHGQRPFGLTPAMIQALGIGTGARLTRLTCDDTAHPVRTPLVGVPSYIAELLAVTDLDALAVAVPAATDPLLKVLLRHALLRAYADAAAGLRDQPSLPTRELPREAGPVFPGTTISELREALSLLAPVDESTLERHLVGTLDATSHRLDAWVTSLATRRLSEQRAAQPFGLSVGGYAWVENLHPAPAGPVVNPVGFIHAPSLNQASAAALLRNAHLAHAGRPDSPFAIDAASDAVHAEAALRLVRGDGIATGERVTHRVALVLRAADTSPGPGWASDTPRARAEPVLNAWAGRLLGPADTLSVRVEELDAAGEVVLTHLVPFGSLGLAPIDVVWMTAGTGTGGGVGELAQRVLAAVLAGPGGPAPGARLRVDLGRVGPDRGVGDIAEVATRIRELLATARSLDGADLLPPHAEPVRGLDLDEFDRRAAAAERALAGVRAALAAAIGRGDDLRRPLLDVAAFGVTGALPTSDGPLTAQANALLAELDRRLGTAVRVPPAPQPSGEIARRDQILARFRAVFGSGFLALPRFTAANAADVAASLADTALLAGDPLAAHTWLLRVERARVALARLGRPVREAEVLGTGQRLSLSVAQLPHRPGQRWLGLPRAPGRPPIDGTLSLVLAQVPSTLDGQLCGVMVDEWTELIASRRETTGIAFQFDPPDSVAPQAILLAVPPVLGREWTVDGLNRVLFETLDLARLRLVGPGALGEIRQFLPAAFLPFNLDGDTVSTDLVALTT